MLTVMHWNAVRSALSSFRRHMLAVAFAGTVLFLLVTAWFDLTFYEAWLTGAKWMRFPFLLLALLPYHIAEETVLGPATDGKKWRRLGKFQIYGSRVRRRRVSRSPCYSNQSDAEKKALRSRENYQTY